MPVQLSEVKLPSCRIGVEKFRMLTRGNDGFQDIFCEKSVCVHLHMQKRESIRANTIGSCGEVQGLWYSGMETAQKK